LAALPDRVAKGEKIDHAAWNSPAVLVSVTKTEAKLSHEEIVEGMTARRKRVKGGPMSVKEMINEARRC